MNAESYLLTIIGGIVEYPNEVKIEKTIDELGCLLTVDCHSKDIPYVLGKEGKMASTLRTLMRSFGYRHKQHISIKINAKFDQKPDFSGFITI